MYSKGFWNKKEKIIFIYYFNKYKNNKLIWKLISKKIKTRTNVQVRSHYQKFILQFKNKIITNHDLALYLQMSNLDEFICIINLYQLHNNTNI